ncbi:MAG: ribulose-phosphate 3-epimerase [Lachnospirales bacterium]
MILSPSILSADFGALGRDINITEKCGVKYCHIDVMDGIFVPNISIGIPVVKSIRKISNCTFDVHLMIQRPRNYIKDFIDAGADIVTIHLESEGDTMEDLKLIKELEATPSITIKPNTPIEEVYPYLSIVKQVLIMTVEPGFGGQKLIESTLNKIQELKKYITNNALNIDIEVDGGINLDNVALVAEKGANVIVMGSAIYNKNGIEKNVAKFKEIFKI